MLLLRIPNSPVPELLQLDLDSLRGGGAKQEIGGGAACELPMPQPLIKALRELVGRHIGIKTEHESLGDATEDPALGAFRLIFQGTELGGAGPSKAAERAVMVLWRALNSGAPCSIEVLFRLLGGKGGFGSTLKGQKNKGKKTTNFDSMRDLTGKRIRHSKAVERIKEWMAQQKKDDELVAQLKLEGPEGMPKKAETRLDESYVDELDMIGKKADVVAEGMCEAENAERIKREEERKRSEFLQDPMSTSRKRLREEPATEKASAPEGARGQAIDWMNKQMGWEESSSGDSEPETAASASSAGPSNAASASSASGPKASTAESVGLSLEVSGSSSSQSSANPTTSGNDSSAPTTTVSTTTCPVATPLPKAEEIDILKLLGLVQQPPAALEKMGVDAKSTTPGHSDAHLARVSGDQKKPPKNPPEPVTKPKPLIQQELEPVNVYQYSSAEEMEANVGGERLKAQLEKFGLKCGGTPLERAKRLFLLKDTPLEKLPKKELAPKKKVAD